MIPDLEQIGIARPRWPRHRGASGFQEREGALHMFSGIHHGSPTDIVGTVDYVRFPGESQIPSWATQVLQTSPDEGDLFTLNHLLSDGGFAHYIVTFSSTLQISADAEITFHVQHRKVGGSWPLFPAAGGLRTLTAASESGITYEYHTVSGTYGLMHNTTDLELRIAVKRTAGTGGGRVHDATITILQENSGSSQSKTTA